MDACQITVDSLISDEPNSSLDNGIAAYCEVSTVETELAACEFSVLVGVDSESSATGDVTKANQDYNSVKDKTQEYKRLCKEHGFKPPIHLDEFDFCYVATFDSNDLEVGYRFLTNDELALIPRKINKPFCHPGPEMRNEIFQWYLVDSILQQIQLKNDPFPNFVVRWVGYEDSFNTVEPFANVNHTSVLKLFLFPDLYTACRSNYTSCVRRSTKLAIQQPFSSQTLPLRTSVYDRSINNLISLLRIEERCERYSFEVGFISRDSVQEALDAQYKFIIEKFIPLIEELKAPLVVDSHYINNICGNLQRTAKFKKNSKRKSAASVKSYIYTGLRKAKKKSSEEPSYVCFFVPMKRDVKEKSDKKQLNFHMCGYILESKDGTKNAIYYNPSPPCFKCKLPTVVEEMTDPIVENTTNMFGEASGKDDCVFQCMKHFLGLATGHIKFKLDLSQPSKKYGRFNF